MRLATAALALGLMLAPTGAKAATVDGANVHWTSQGSGPQTVILVHGWTCDESSWQGQVPVLAKAFRVITLDLPGHGKSGMPKAFTMEMFSRAIEAVRAEAKVEKAVLAGHSMGTPVIRKYALMYPDRVAGLVLVDGLVQLGSPGGGSPAGPALPNVNGAARAGIVRSMFGPLTTPALQEHILKMMLAPSDAAAAGAFAATWDPSQWSDQKLTIPVLAVYAGTRAVATEAAVKALYPKAEYLTIPETAHFLMMEKPAEFNRMISAFVDRVGSSAAGKIAPK